MNYYTETLHYDHDSLKNALGKGRDDYFEMLRRMGFTIIPIPSFRKSRFMSAGERMRFERRLTHAWKEALKQIEPGDTLVIHSPNSEKFLAYAQMIKKLHKKGVRIITLTFELETFFVMDYRRFARLKRFSSKRTEAVLFRNSDAIVVHNDVMKKKLGDAGFDTDKMFSVGVMDYLCEDNLSSSPDDRIKRDKPVIYAGHLTAEKSTFEYDLPPGFRCNLYGPDYTGPVNDDVHYMGAFDPMTLMNIMEGSFGLVWEGNSCSGCYGAYGDYLTFNNPHKIALYLASGFPVIVWSGAAMADFVRKEKCGLIVDDLYCVPKLIADLSDDEYENMRLNACRVGSDMRKGVHIRQAVENAVDYIADKNRKHNDAYVIFTREPVPGTTKTRLMPYYSAEKCAELHRCFLGDMAREMEKADADIIVAYTGGEPVYLREVFGSRANYILQRGDDLGQRMENAFTDAFSMGYDRVILTGTDIPELKAESVNNAFEMLDRYDIVLGPVSDGGYYLIGMKHMHHEAFNVKLYGVSTVFEETLGSIKKSGLCVGTADEYSDIDDKDDIAGLVERLRKDPSAAGPHTRHFLRNNMSVSVIVPVYNEEETITAMMDQLRPYKDEAEIIFVDGQSTDGTLSAIGDEFRVIRCEKGRGKQLNAGAMAAGGDVLFFLHCDSILPKDFLNDIRRCEMKRPFGCFGVRFDSHNFFMLTNRVISNYRALFRGIAFGDQGMFIERNLFFEAGMFPEIPVMEDYEFSLKMKERGCRPVMTRRRLLSSSRRYGKGTLGILKTEMLMWHLRALYRMGEDPGKIKTLYKDIREHDH